jgi:3-methylcrotonyl-CoA carboxylase alpha subunit
MFARILIANRGEIACRIVRTARRLGIATVAVYSEADADALHVAVADEARAIGPPPPQESYLSIERLVDAAAASRADAVHPGYGFLSENAAFAEACRERGIAFIGPSAQAIRAMGSKSAAKDLMATAGVPVIPGYHGSAQELSLLTRAAAEIGYPVLVKAAAGGGGRGMRRVDDPDALAAAVESARREAKAAFGDDTLLIEKYVERSRHVEVQVLADRHGCTLHVFERDCSMQRRNQKVIEEAPAPGLDADLRRRLGEAAVTAARAVDYEGAGTLEFLLGPDGRFFFLEMNTRLQVEHPVTEMISGLDLVEWQIRIAAGEPLAFAQDDLAINGHAFEARIYAEDPARDFLPAAGLLRHLRFPENGPSVRVETGVRQGDTVGTFYDPMIAKLVVWGTDRPAALRRLRSALEQVQVVGPPVNVAFLSSLAGHPAFAAAAVDTGFIDRHRHELVPVPGAIPSRFLALASLDVLLRRDREVKAAAARSAEPQSPWNSTAGWRLNDDNFHVLTFHHDGVPQMVTIHYREGGVELDLPGEAAPMQAHAELDGAGDLMADLGGVRVRATVVRHGDDMILLCGGETHRLALDDPAARASLKEAPGGSLTAPLPGRVVDVLVAPGDVVRRGATLMVLEAMKMEHAVVAPADGTVETLHYRVGEQVEEGAVLVSFVEAS